MHGIGYELSTTIEMPLNQQTISNLVGYIFAYGLLMNIFVRV